MSSSLHLTQSLLTYAIQVSLGNMYIIINMIYKSICVLLLPPACKR